jgi:Circularly permutated YpsA SLOG family
MGTGLSHTKSAEGRAVAESDLRALLRSEPGLTVLTGGQTGVDTYAAVGALQAGLRVHMVFPKGFRQEDGELTMARHREVSGAVVHELSWASFRYRTWTCAYIADAIVLLDPAGGAGCRETAQAARKLGRPLLCPEPGEVTADGAAEWLAENDARVLMVAGCRGSLLASKGKEHGVRTDLSALMAAARLHHERLTGRGSGAPADPC